jgi:hypothetical protein
MKPMMKCGHAATGKDGDGRPSCVSCAGLDPGAHVVDESPPSLDGRTARCVYCRHEAPSSTGLAFFEYLGPGSNHYRAKGNPKPNDAYYCGCRGWD